MSRKEKQANQDKLINRLVEAMGETVHLDDDVIYTTEEPPAALTEELPFRFHTARKQWFLDLM